MSTYNLTPSERRARAQSLKEQRKNRYLYSNYLAQKQEVENRAEQERLSAISDKNEKESKNFFTRSISTIGDIASNVITGAAKGLEGIVDLGAGIVGGIGGLFDKSFQDSVKSHIAYDWTGKNIGAPLQEATKYSYTKDGGIIEGVASGIGQMLPAVAVSFATAGIGAAASGASMATSMGSTAAQMASLATLGVSAAGNSTEEAFNEGADYYKGLGYGLASGAVEVATEKMYGGATKQLFGKGVLDGVGKSVADTGIKRIAKNALKEGAEEVVAELANPALKGLYKGGEAFEEYKAADYWKGVAKAGAIGSLTAIAYSGTVGYGMSKAGMGYVGKEADINDSLAEIEIQKKKADNLFANEKLTEKNEATITSNLKGNYQNIETALKKSSETKRVDMIKKFSLESAFETDGSMKAVFASKIGLVDNIEQVSEDTANDGSKALASLDKRYYTPSLRGSEQIIQKELGEITANLQENENRIALEEGRNAQQISSVTPYIGELSDTGKASFTKVKKGLNYLNGKSGSKVNIVIINPHEMFNGNIYNDKTIYLGADTLENGKWAGTLVHEYTHFTEGSKDYNRLIKFMREDSQLFETAVQTTAKAGYMSSEALDTIIGKIESKKELTLDEARAYGTFQSEINAHMTEILLDNESFIAKIVRGDTTIAENVLNKINDLKAMFKSFDSKESRAEYKELEKAEKLYLKAVENAGYKYSNRKIIRTDKEELDAEGEMRYNKKTPYIQWKSDALAWANDSKRKVGDMDSGADNGYYYFYEAIDPYGDGKTTDYRVVAKVRMSDATRLDEWFEEVKSNNERNNASIYERLNGYEREREKYQSNSSTTLGKYSRDGQNDSLHQSESEGNGERDTRRGGEDKRGVKFSLKETLEKDYEKAIASADIEAAQKLVDNAAKLAGYTIKAYHGSRYLFNEFSKNKRGSHTHAKVSSGWFFASDEETANSYYPYGTMKYLAKQYPNMFKESEADTLKEKGKLYSLYLKAVNPLELDVKDYDYTSHKENMDSWVEYAEQAEKNGNDCVILYNALDNQLKTGERTSTVYMFRESSQVKSTDPITYDDNGNIIPLSKRFDDSNNDIRFSRKDSDGNALSQEQIDFFKDSKVRDNEGNLLVVYHGTSENFNTFDKTKIKIDNLGKGFYFVNNDLIAASYANRRTQERGGKERVIATYLNMKKPFNVDNISDSEIKSFLIYDYENSGRVRYEYRKKTHKVTEKAEVYTTEMMNDEDIPVVNGKKDYSILFETSEPNFQSWLHKNGYDGLIVSGEDIKTKTKGVAYVIFNSNQIKLTSNLTPTENDDIRFSRKDSEFDIPDDFFDSLILKEMLEDIGDINTNIEEHKLTKAERRETYIDKLYNKGNLNKVITKIVKDKPQMWEYFKNSKMNKKFDPLMLTKNDELLVMFHGSPKLFYSFDSNKIGKNGTLMGSGFYFTEAKEFAESYRNNNDGKVVAALLKIEKPLSRNKNSITQTELRDFVRKVVDENGEDWLSNYGDVNNLGYEKLLDKAIKEVCKYNSNEADLIESIFLESKMNFDDFHSNLTKMLGYDGIIAWNKAEGTQAIVFKSNQIKDIFNYSPTENVDIRYSKKEGEKYYKLTEGQLKKIIANNTKYKTYTLADSEAIISNVLGNYMSFGDAYGELSGKTKKQVIDMLWKGLNSADIGYQTNVALNIADYIIQNGVLENIYGDEDAGWAVDTIYILKPYLHSLDLNGIKGEIKYKYDTDKSPYLLWGKRRGSSGIAPDQLGQLLENSGIQIDAINEADIFMQVDDLYRSAVKALKKKAKTFLTEGLSNKELKNLRQEIAREVLNGFDYTGENSKLANIVNKYTDRIRLLKEQLQDEKVKNSVINRLLDKTQKLKDLKLGTFLNATEFKNDIFKGSIEKLAAIKFRGDLNQSGTRDILKGLAEWYVESNEIVGEAYEKDIGEVLNEIVNGKGKLTTKELCNLTNIVDYFKHFVETYNKVFRNGQYVEAQPIAEKYIQMLKDNKAIKVGWFNKVSGSAYERIFGDPMSVARRMDMYESGFYTEMLERLRKSTVDAAIDEMNIRAELDKFLLENKKYLKKASKKTIKYLGKDIPLMEALYVYMALGRKQAQLGLEKSGFTFTQDKETIRVNGFDTEGKMVESAQNDIFDQLNETDKKFIEIAKKIFNEECKERKRKTDIDRRGYSNVSEDEYVPIRRANIAKNVDTSTFKEEMDRVSNASFNKDTVQGAKQELIAEPLNVVLDRHIHAIAQYANLATTIDEYNKLFSLDISGNKDKPVSVATESKNTWKDGNEYFQKLISDIQGVPASKGVGNRAISFVRGNYAKYQLGFNPKVWLTQLSSFAAAGSILDVKSIIQGLGISSRDIDEYSPLAKLRNKNNTAAMAQGVLSKSNGKVNLTKLNDFSDLLMKPIGMVDRFVVKKLFGACQAQVERENGLKIGTAENKQKAAELLDKVILETQQNSMATERSAAMRSGSEFMKTITMFSADAMKVVGRVIDSYGEVSALKARKRIETDSAKIGELDKRIKAAQKKTAKSVASLVTSAVIMALIAQLFRTLYNKDDEEDDITQNMAIDAIGNLLGGLPFIRDIYSRFTQGYEISGYAYSALNDLLDTGVGIFDIVGDIFSGKADSKDIALNIKKLTYAGGQLLGLPTRNVYNIVYGLTKRFSPSVAYKVDDMFYNQKYSSNLAKAIEDGDDSMIATIAGIMLNENVGEIKEAPIREEMNSLISNGFSVLPRSIGDKITYEDEEIALTNKQKEQFKKVYSGANSKVASLLNLSQYKSATEEVRAKAIKYIYDIYYNLALEDLLGVDLENKNLLFAEAIDIEKLAIIVAQAKAFTSDTDKNGKTVAGSKKAKLQAYVNALQLSAAQKYMIMGYLGYSNAKGKNQVKGYIQRLSLSKTQKEQLFEFSGYAA